MTFDWTTFALQLINVVILLAILRHFLFRPVAGIIAKRQTETDAALKRAQAASDAAKAAEAKARDEAEATIRARHAEMAKVQAEADAARSALLEKARADAAQIVAEGQAARDRQAGIAEARTRERARDLAGTIAGRAGGCCAFQCSAISMRRANHTLLWLWAYSTKRFSAANRPGRPASRQCRPIFIIFGAPACPSA